ncbi:hypothetical protein [Caproicibacterium sp. XB1]|uniref:hypothetical protein n=1 Tax=Caproicibacterium sp. XB1 TaxID=3396405 RepID=UPI0039B6EF01
MAARLLLENPEVSGAVYNLIIMLLRRNSNLFGTYATGFVGSGFMTDFLKEIYLRQHRTMA